MTYQAPVRDLAFSLAEAAGAERLKPHFADFDETITDAVLEAAGELCSGVLAPLNRSGDQEGAHYANGTVTLPKGFAAAYKAFAEGGWTGLSAHTAYGGQGLPKALELAVYEMVNGANMSFALCPTLTLAAIEALTIHGTDRQKAIYLPRMVTGEWTGTMQLTEPQAGSDLGQIRTMARRAEDGSWRLTGQKIFITWGDHDATSNIIGMVLARSGSIEDGVRGLSLFVVPKFMVADDGSLGDRNSVRPVSIEHKMGINASPTCVMAFEDAKGELVGQEGQGLAHMFIMMNAARVQIGAQGCGVADGAYQKALEFARERRQGRSPWSADKPAAIIDQPDVRRMLVLSKAKIEAARGLYLSAGVSGDLAARSDNAEERAAAKRREELLTPIAKAWSTDMGVEVSSLALQVHGGMGFIEETGIAQYYRDARIPPIYEGTNGIQANDLVGRKLAMDNGLAVDELLDEIEGDLARVRAVDDLEGVARRLKASLEAARHATAEMKALKGSPEALAGAVAYTRLMGDLAGGWMLAKGAVAASRRMHEDAADDEWLRSKVTLARFFADQVLTASAGLAEAALAGAGDLKIAL